MKKIISILLAALVPMLMLASCADKPAAETSSATVKGDEFTAGIYYMSSEQYHSVQIQIRDDYKIAIQYNHKTITESGKYTVDGDVLRADIEKNGCEYVFNIKDGKLYYDAAASTPSDKFISDAGIADGAEFYLDHGFQVR